MESQIIRPDPDRESLTEERCSILEILNHPDLPALSLARARVEPGVRTANHALDFDEVYYVLSGEGVMYFDGEQAGAVTAGDSVVIRRGVAQCIENTGSEDLVFLCICNPRFVETGYQAREETWR